MRKLISMIILIFLFCSFSLTENKDLLKKADLLLDMMEYESAIINYLKALSGNPLQKDIRKKIAYAYYQLGKIEQSFKFLKEELELFPENEDAYDFLIYLLYKLNKLDEVSVFFQKTGNNLNIGGLGCFILGMHYKRNKDYMKAEIYFRRALKKGFDRIQCYVQLLDMYINQLKFFNDGVEIESGLIKIHPALFENQKVSSLLAKATDSFKYWGPEYLYVIGLRYFEKSKGEVNSIFMRRAIDFFKLTLDLSPKFKDSLFSLGAINYNISNFREAEEYFRRILYFEPENKEVKYYLECALKKLNNSKKEESSSSCPDIINLSREFIDNPDIEYKYKFHNDITYVRENINNLALEFIEKGKFKEAMKRFKNALKIYPQCPIVNYNIGWVYFWLNDYKNAEKHALIALRRKNFYTRLPDNLSKKERNELLKMSINIHVESNIPISQWNFEVALKEGNYFPEDYNLLGNIYFKIKDYSRALLAFKKILEIDPKDPIGHYNLGCVYSALNDWRKAEEEWKKAIKYEKGVKRTEKREEISRSYLRVSLLVFKYPVAFRAHKSLGWLYLDRNLPDKALKEFEEAIKLEPGDPEPYYELGKIYFSKNNHKKAIYYFEKYLYLGGEKEKVKRILNSIKRRK